MCGERRRRLEEEKRKRLAQDLQANHGLSKYQRKKLAKRGIDIKKAFGGPS